MSKLIWGLGSLVVLATAAIGGNLYADKSLHLYYQQNQKTNLVSIQYKNFNMGAMQGSADWAAQLSFDPCKPKDVLMLTGKDEIKRSWNGYHIESKINLQQGSEVFQKILTQPLTAQTTIDWLGVVHSSLTTPVFEKNDADIQTRIDSMTFKVDAKSKDDQLKILNAKLEIPNMTVSDKLGHLEMREVELETTQGLSSTLDEGKTQLNIASIKRTDRNVQQFGSGEFKDFALMMNTGIDQHTVNFDTQLNIKEVVMHKIPTLQKLQMNFNLKALNKQKVQAFFDLLEKNSEVCVAKEELTPELANSLLSIVNEGFSFESQNNQINLGEGFAKASLSGKVMPGHQSSFASLVKMAPSLVEYQANVEYDKQIMKTLISNYMQQGGKTLSDQELEQMLNGMQQAVQAKRKGDVLKIGIEYKYGEKKFLN
ncbi:DUF945 family protein [Acinetobacter terrestris]|uniref:DUF945 family protein n=1 Tax=Acinetobacter terrestris TaxID=2529843 RepID=A0AAW6UUI8_9GAMM|nr:DUF945 family protein [Acinetobacter terrestris]MDK1683743.1 DUF945 family protein [Acinetobacter terrestris]